MLKLHSARKVPVCRVLRYYERIAAKEYWCCKCGMQILAGDEYGANVTVLGIYFYVDRFHMHCPIEPDEEREEREHRERQEHDRQSLSKKSESKKAA